MELALEGERRCKKGDCQTGVVFLEEAVAKRESLDKADARTLSAIYRWDVEQVEQTVRCGRKRVYK